MSIEHGKIIEFTTEEVIGNKDQVFINHDQFPQHVNESERILCDDGKVVFNVVKTNKKDKVTLRVVHGTELSSRKGINLPDTKTSLPAVTEKDLNDLEFILQQDVHWIALSFVREAKIGRASCRESVES